MADRTNPDIEDPKGAVPSAEQLRMSLLEAQMAEFDRREKAKAAELKRLSDFSDDFMRAHVSDEERAMIRRLVANALKEGKMEAMVYSFPSALCTDGGRAINSMAAHWPETLQGKAKELYDRFKTNVQPKGYRLRAMIINFPGGIPGDVGFFLNWAPEEA